MNGAEGLAAQQLAVRVEIFGLAPIATIKCSFVTGHERVGANQDGIRIDDQEVLRFDDAVSVHF